MRTLVLAILLFCTTAAEAQELTARGRQIVDGSVGASWSNARQPGLLYRTPHYQVWLQPSWVYFLRDGLGLGGYLGYRFAQESTGLGSKTDRQARPNPQLDGERDLDSYFKQPLSHSLSFGITAVWGLFRRQRLSLLARPYVGMAVTWRELRRTGDDFAWTVRWQWRHELRPQAGLHLPFVYQLNANLGFGLGPDFGWQRASNGFDAFELGFSSWIARAF